jgi:hypothetical protein
MLTETDKAGIRASVYQWSQRKSIPSAVIDDFIEIALSRATRALRIPPLEFFQTIPITAEGYAELPFDFMEAKEVYVVVNGKNVLLERKAINEVDWTFTASDGNCPVYFGRFGNALRVAPWKLGSESTLKLYYYKIIPPMKTDDASNWFTLYAPEVLLYGALVELCNYTRDSEGMAIWNSKFNEAVNIIQGVEDRAEWRGSTVAVSLRGSTPR